MRVHVDDSLARAVAESARRRQSTVAGAALLLAGLLVVGFDLLAHFAGWTIAIAGALVLAASFRR